MLGGTQQAAPTFGDPQVLPFNPHHSARSKPLLHCLTTFRGSALAEDKQEVAGVVVLFLHPGLVEESAPYNIASLDLDEGGPRGESCSIQPLHLGVNRHRTVRGEALWIVDDVSREPRVYAKEPLARGEPVLVPQLVLGVGHLSDGPLDL